MCMNRKLLLSEAQMGLNNIFGSSIIQGDSINDCFKVFDVACSAYSSRDLMKKKNAIGANDPFLGSQICCCSRAPYKAYVVGYNVHWKPAD